MKKSLLVILIVFVMFGINISIPVFAEVLPRILSRMFIIQAEKNGEAWYVDNNFHRYYLSPEGGAIEVLEKIENDKRISSSSNKSIGLMHNNLNSEGSLTYIEPISLTTNNIENPKDLFSIISLYSLGISEENIIKIPIGFDVNDLSIDNLVDNDEFQNLGWWGKINKEKIPVLDNPSASSTVLGYFGKINKVKILEHVTDNASNNETIWYKIDGGSYPGAFVNSKHIDPIAQPTPPEKFDIPESVEKEEYWIDLNLTSKILTLFKYDEPVFVTYAAIGRPSNPTLSGTYKIWSKFKKTGMHGGPPIVPYYYNLSNVPWVMYYRDSYAIHGTYWHDEFGSQKSAGCTNLTQGDAKYLFEILSPNINKEINFVRSSENNNGSIVFNHY